MKFQELVSDVRSRVESVGKQYQGVFKAYFDAQRQVVGVVTKNSRTLAGTELGAAKNAFAAARASFDKARADGVRKVASSPHSYVPNGRDQIVSAYKDTIDVMVRTGNELTQVVSTGYKSVLDNLASSPASPRTESTATRKNTTAANTTATTSGSADKPAKSSASTAAKKTTAAKRKTASARTTKTSTAEPAKASTAGNTAENDNSAS